MVLTQLIWQRLCAHSMLSFPYHYGSYATGSRRWIGVVTVLFPYHYGSYATTEGGMKPESVTIVSIPLWFLRNRLSCLILQTQYSSFHTTMVLTQRASKLSEKRSKQKFPYHYGSYATMTKDERFEELLTFPYHYGSYATDESTKSTIFNVSFHTTMVLTQR